MVARVVCLIFTKLATKYDYINKDEGHCKIINERLIVQK